MNMTLEKFSMLIRFSMLFAVSALLVSCSSTSPKPEPGQALFSNPEEAVSELKTAAKSNDVQRLSDIFGKSAESIAVSGDGKQDRESRAWFSAKADEKISFVEKDGRVFVELGKDAWPFPVPLAKSGDKWFFDSPAGIEEILTRRIGRNEIFAISICDSIVKAQKDFYKKMKDPKGNNYYASAFLNNERSGDGLIVHNPKKFKDILGSRLIMASDECPPQLRIPLNGYYYKILNAQGESAPGGAKSYASDGKLVGGFAVAAYPVSYGVSGVKTFIVSANGIVFEKDLGQGTTEKAQKMDKYDPDESWMPVR